MESTFGTIVKNLTKSLEERVKDAISEDNRNYYVSIHVYDLLGIINLRPLYSEWLNLIRPNDLIVSEELESFIFKECIDYAMSNSELKFTTGIEVFMVYLRLTIKDKFKIDIPGLSPNNDLCNRYMKTYFTSLCSRLNTITQNAPIICDKIEDNIGLLGFGSFNEYFEVSDIPLYEISSLNVSFKNNKFIGFLHLIIFARI